MEWTTNTPTEPGQYWWRYAGSKMSIILTVFRLLDDGKLYVREKDNDTPAAEWLGGFWAGPIEPPAIPADEKIVFK